MCVSERVRNPERKEEKRERKERRERFIERENNGIIRRKGWALTAIEHY